MNKMPTFNVLLIVTLAWGATAPTFGRALDTAAGDASSATDKPAVPLGTNLVARVEGLDVPYAWFLNEFRSTFFRHGQDPDVRQKVFDEFADKLALYVTARNNGVPDDPAVKTLIREKVESARSFMQYQLTMMEMSIVIESYLRQQKLTPEDYPVSDEELKAYFEEKIATMPNAPKSLDDVQPQIKEQIRLSFQREQALMKAQALATELRKKMKIEVNQELVDNVPFPQMTGNAPFAGAPPPRSPPSVAPVE